LCQAKTINQILSGIVKNYGVAVENRDPEHDVNRDPEGKKLGQTSLACLVEIRHRQS
jgi:hypothetical protein